MKELQLKVEEKIHNNNICKYHLLPALSTSRISFFTFLKFFFTFCFQHFLTLNKYFLGRRISKQIDDIMNRTFPNWYGKISEIQGALMLLDSALIGNLDLIPSGSIPDRLKRIPPIYMVSVSLWGILNLLGNFSRQRTCYCLQRTWYPLCAVWYITIIREDRYR